MPQARATRASTRLNRPIKSIEPTEPTEPIEPIEPTEPNLLNSYEDCIYVVLDNCQREQPIDATYRPNYPPEPAYGTTFELLEMPDREPQFLPLPPTALELLQTFIPEGLVAHWVDYMNKAAEVARIRNWHPVSLAEIYLWLAMLIYMGMHRESAFRGYWQASTAEGFEPIHPITKLMPSRRFEQLRVRLRICALAYTDDHNHNAFDCIDKWPTHI
ncbi:hypothetical protein S40285_09461 [Stachybotrys chlorohalonatus IBT 40285]|uniref:PiggyBac transposable element-derived protein domain-containing protein n=1 Tax=Stachybotrys chlorohalonatus (strain IBT 40285) TaxID=1283841 RepID=A0A084QZU8_STAC4|nr:hypothetical protein S40285_09461 [Stachybotrys chlorohalonata IBT 40285]